MYPRDKVSESLGLVFATISRPHVMQRLVTSVRKQYPTLSIYVADQSTPNDQIAEFYHAFNCKVVWMEHDAGVCAARNSAVDMVREPYFILCDDDFVITEETDFEPALNLLEQDDTIGIVGGRLIDIHVDDFFTSTTTAQRFWELLLFYDEQKGKLTSVPVHYFAPEPIQNGMHPYYECDAVMNFAVFRTSMFDDIVRWDPRFKSNGEHEDFYLNFKVNGRHRVVYMPTLVAGHHHPPLEAYSKLRGRSVGWQRFLEKWSLKQFLELDGGLRIVNSFDRVQNYAMGYQSFYSGATLLPGPRGIDHRSVTFSNVSEGMVSSRMSRMLTSRQPAGTNFYQFRLGVDGSVVTSGGTWHRAISEVLTLPAAARREEREWRIEAVWRSSEAGVGDKFVLIKPICPPDAIIDELQYELSALQVTISVALDDLYILYNEPALIYAQHLVANCWNAIAIPQPRVSGQLAVELSIKHDERVVFSDARLMTFA